MQDTQCGADEERALKDAVAGALRDAVRGMGAMERDAFLAALDGRMADLLATAPSSGRDPVSEVRRRAAIAAAFRSGPGEASR